MRHKFFGREPCHWTRSGRDFEYAAFGLALDHLGHLGVAGEGGERGGGGPILVFEVLRLTHSLPYVVWRHWQRGSHLPVGHRLIIASLLELCLFPAFSC